MATLAGSATLPTTVSRAAAYIVEKKIHREIFTPAQWKTIFAFTSAVIREVPVEQLRPGGKDVDPEALERFAKATADEENVGFGNMMAYMIATSATASARAGFAFVLDMLKLVLML